MDNERRFERWRLALRMIALREAAEAVKHLSETDPVRVQTEADFKAAKAVYQSATGDEAIDNQGA